MLVRWWIEHGGYRPRGQLQTLHSIVGVVRRRGATRRGGGWEVAFCSGFHGSDAIVHRAMEVMKTLRTRFPEPESQGMVDHVSAAACLSPVTGAPRIL